MIGSKYAECVTHWKIYSSLTGYFFTYTATEDDEMCTTEEESSGDEFEIVFD